MPALSFYNSLTKKIEPFSPQEPGKVSLYHCGPTVYKRQHIGNMRRFLFADFLRRTLELFSYEVREITNITDVGHLTQDDIDAGEDKVAKAAREAKVTPQAIAQKQTKLFMADQKLLNIQPSHKYPRASQHIEQMQRMIAALLADKHAYQTKSGIYFDVTTFPAYGALSGNTLAALESGKRIAVREDKRHPADFALWVFDDKSLQKWDSPWGVGYPGWHIECSAMSLEYLDSPIDIHTGGEDNRFPHHENEIAQSEAATGQPFVRWWMHNRHLQLEGEKLSKREGEQITLDTIIEKGFDPLAFRLLIFAAHYRQKMDFSWELLQTAQDHLTSIENTLRRLREMSPTIVADTHRADVIDTFKAALADDLNTPKAWAEYLGYVKSLNTAMDTGSFSKTKAAQALATLTTLDHVIGVVTILWQRLAQQTIPTEIQQLVDARQVAKTQKDFAEADRLRQAIEDKGFTLQDTSHGPRVIKKTAT